MTEVEVALVGRDAREFLPRGPESFLRSFYDEDENTRPWSERRRVALTVEDDETLGEIFDRAVAEFGVYEADWSTYDGKRDHGTRRFIALRDDASPIKLVDRLSGSLTVVDQQGRAVWNKRHQDVTYLELRRAAEAGSVPGDPREVYVCVRLDAAGGGLYHQWQLLLQAWDVAMYTATTVATVGGAYKVIAAVRRRLAGREVVKSKTQEWLKRNGHADSLRYMLRGEPWAARDLAALLGCTSSEAEDVLALYGYERSATEDTWVYVAGNPTLGLAVGDLSAQIVVVYVDEVQRRYLDGNDAPEDELRTLFTEILRQASEKGEVGDLRHVKWDEDRLWRPPVSRFRMALRRFVRRKHA